MITRKQLQETAEQLPEAFLLEDAMDKLILLDKIGKVEKESTEGDVISEVELEQEMQKWFK
jgi:hypothetical protein